MEIESYTPNASAKSGIPDFDTLKPGQSIWVKTNAERMRLWRAFKAWEADRHRSVEGRTVTVGEDDPRGKGFRLVITRRPVALKPHVAAAMRFLDDYQPIERRMFETRGIFDHDDVMAAAEMEGALPTTVAEVKAFIRLLVSGKAKYTEKYLADNGLPSREEMAEVYRAGRRQEDEARRAAALAKPPKLRDVPPSIEWKRLAHDVRVRLLGAGITEEVYADAVQSFPESYAPHEVIEALSDGYGQYHAYLVRVRAMRGDAAIGDDGGAEE